MRNHASMRRSSGCCIAETKSNHHGTHYEVADARIYTLPEQPVPSESVADSITCGADGDKHVVQIRAYLDAGADEVYVQQIGPDMDGFFTAWEKVVLPQLVV
jgi:hypothetical protein